MQPKRRSYTKTFKAQIIQECAQPDASIAGVAQNHGLNANLVHKWIRVQSQQSVALQNAFIPLSVRPTTVQPSQAAIHIEISHARGAIMVDWPTDNAAACATFLRDLLR